MIVTAKQYAEKIGMHPTSVTKKLCEMSVPALPFADSVMKIGNSWVITLSPSFSKSKAKKIFSEL